MSDTAITVEHLYKEYKLGVIGHGTLYRDIQSWWARIRGKEDPNSLILANYVQKAEQHSFLALNDVSLEIKEGDRVGIIGKNGAGKSTLLKIISRITSPSKGKITIRGKVASLLEVGTGFHPELTGRENIFLNGSILGMNRLEISRKLDEIVDFAGIEKHIDTPVKRYSSGMMVRLGFAVAAYLDTDILIADEVLAVGDAEFQKKALGKMQDLSTGQGRTVLFVSHNMSAVKNLCNCGILLEKGKIKKISDNTGKLIFDYLNDFSSQGETTKWTNNGEYNDPYFTPLSMELLEEDGTEIKTEISADKSYLIKLTFEVRETSRELFIEFFIATIDGTVLFVSNPLDYINSYQPIVGINTLYCKIPKNLFSVQEYVISLGASFYSSKWIVDLYAYSITLKMNVVSKTIINPFGIVQTPIYPIIEWYNNLPS